MQFDGWERQLHATNSPVSYSPHGRNNHFIDFSNYIHSKVKFVSALRHTVH